eukprot:3660869-Amphidinium_carterae.1
MDKGPVIYHAEAIVQRGTKPSQIRERKRTKPNERESKPGSKQPQHKTQGAEARQRPKPKGRREGKERGEGTSRNQEKGSNDKRAQDDSRTTPCMFLKPFTENFLQMRANKSLTSVVAEPRCRTC